MLFDVGEPSEGCIREGIYRGDIWLDVQDRSSIDEVGVADVDEVALGINLKEWYRRDANRVWSMRGARREYTAPGGISSRRKHKGAPCRVTMEPPHKPDPIERAEVSQRYVKTTLFCEFNNISLGCGILRLVRRLKLCPHLRANDPDRREGEGERFRRGGAHTSLLFSRYGEKRREIGPIVRYLAAMIARLAHNGYANLHMSHATSIAYVAFGGNVGVPSETFSRALPLLGERIGAISAVSSLYETKALTLDGAEQPNYINAVIELSTSRDAEEILRRLLAIERALGRDRSNERRWEPRAIDLDLLFLDDQILQTETLTLPHPEIVRRDFVLRPLAEIAPSFIHPVIGRPISEILRSAEELLLERFVLSKLPPFRQ